MNETRAREVILLQAFETVQPASPSWTDEDRAWATRLALDDVSAGAAHGDAQAFIARRAQHAAQRILPREPAAAKWLGRRLWRARWVLWAALAGLLLGALADSIGSSQRVNLLAPPLWAVVLWNLVVYALLLGHLLARVLMRTTRPGALVRLAQRVLGIGGRLPAPASAVTSAGGGSDAAWKLFAGLWLRSTAALSAARAATMLHAAAAALALGLIAGLYVRGLVLDYRASWESTFLSADAAHAALAVLLAPAVAVSGIALPDVAALEALRAVHGGAVGDTGMASSAAAWIHLYALTLLLLVVLPRSVLALVDGLRSRWLATHLPLPLGEPYFQRLARQQQGDVARVVIVPYASTPGAQAALGLRALLAPALGDGLEVRIAATVAFGAEDDADVPGQLPVGTTMAVALFDLSATPEDESQGRFARQLAARVSGATATIMVVDETAFGQRFGAASGRIAERREGWRRFAESLGTVPVFAALDAPDPTAVAQALQSAMRSPVRSGST
jgi:hypothetical protein